MSEKLQFVASLTVWTRCSADYEATESMRTKVVSGETTIAELMDWVRTAENNSLACSDVRITEAE